MCNIAYVVKIGDRYFTRTGKKGQVQTAWHLAGACFFMEKPTQVLEMLQAKGKSFQVVKIGDEEAFKPVKDDDQEETINPPYAVVPTIDEEQDELPF